MPADRATATPPVPVAPVPLPVVIVAGLARDLVEAAGAVAVRARGGLALAYRVALGGPSPILLRTTEEEGRCAGVEPLATSHDCIACAIRDDVVRTLRSPMKEAVVLRYYLQLSDPEIAEALGIAVGTVKSTLHRARALLKKELS